MTIICYETVITAADNKEKETQVCKVKLNGQMKALKQWLKDNNESN